MGASARLQSCANSSHANISSRLSFTQLHLRNAHFDVVGHEIGHEQADRAINFIQFLLFLNQIRNVVRNGIQELLFALYFRIGCAHSNSPHEEPVAVNNCGGLFSYNRPTRACKKLHTKPPDTCAVNWKMRVPRNSPARFHLDRALVGSQSDQHSLDAK